MLTEKLLFQFPCKPSLVVGLVFPLPLPTQQIYVGFGYGQKENGNISTTKNYIFYAYVLA